ncbi:MAG: hypothetical protein EBR30_01385 [Cytophagia bacterium]|nr:hypothetical protein [Cytophagia bacterium]
MKPNTMPNEAMVKILVDNQCRCMYKVDGPFTYLWVNYEKAIKKGAKHGFEMWGESEQILEKVKSVVFHYYPNAELTSQSGNKNVTFNLNS